MPVASLADLFSDPHLQRVRARLVKRLEQGRDLRGMLHLPDATPEERTALERLLGKRFTGRSIRLDLRLLDDLICRSGVAGGLAGLLARVEGPVVNRAAQREALAQRWQDVWDAASPRDARVAAWLSSLRAEGLLRRLTGGDPQEGGLLLGVALDVVAQLPADGISLAALSAAVTGDSHALDAGRPLHTLVIRYAARLTGETEWTTAEARRRVWAGVGVRCDELSSPALVLNLRSGGHGPLARALDLHAETGEPYRISIRQLLRDKPSFLVGATGGDVFVCENPAVVAAAADLHGPRSRPLVCTEGQPATAVQLLLRALTSAGIRLHYHGDFDWGGLRIANDVYARCGFVPWRYDAAAYRQAPEGKPLSGSPVVALWDGALREGMEARQTAVHEEAVLEWLLGDLGEKKVGSE